MNEATAKESIKRKKKPDTVLISFFGDSSYNWIKPDKLIDFG